MANYDANGTRLIFPNGDEIAPDAKGVKLDQEALANAGVKSWIAEGLLIDLDAVAKAAAEKAASDKADAKPTK